MSIGTSPISCCFRRRFSRRTSPTLHEAAPVLLKVFGHALHGIMRGVEGKIQKEGVVIAFFQVIRKEINRFIGNGVRQVVAFSTG